jgi:hypothetical protein
MKSYIPKGRPVDDDGAEEGQHDAILEVKGIAFLIDAVEEEGVFVREVCAEEETRELLVLDRETEDALLLRF